MKQFTFLNRELDLSNFIPSEINFTFEKPNKSHVECAEENLNNLLLRKEIGYRIYYTEKTKELELFLGDSWGGVSIYFEYQSYGNFFQLKFDKQPKATMSVCYGFMEDRYKSPLNQKFFDDHIELWKEILDSIKVERPFKNIHSEIELKDFRTSGTAVLRN